jgi:hypothetical protein
MTQFYEDYEDSDGDARHAQQLLDEERIEGVADDLWAQCARDILKTEDLVINSELGAEQITQLVTWLAYAKANPSETDEAVRHMIEIMHTEFLRVAEFE